jgi:hypothetical protein
LLVWWQIHRRVSESLRLVEPEITRLDQVRTKTENGPCTGGGLWILSPGDAGERAGEFNFFLEWAEREDSLRLLLALDWRTVGSRVDEHSMGFA